MLFNNKKNTINSRKTLDGFQRPSMLNERSQAQNMTILYDST